MIDKSGPRDARTGIGRPDVDAPAAAAIDDAAADPVDAPAATSVDAPAAASVDHLVAASVDDRAAAAIDDAAADPVDAPAAASVDAPAAASVDHLVAASVDDRAAAAIDDAAADPVDAPAATSIDHPATAAIDHPTTVAVHAPATTAIDAPATTAIDDLERRFGDPWDPGNPTGHAAVLAADEAGEMLVAGERLLDDYGLNAEFVPPELGGRLTRLDQLIEVMRVVFRRDPCLGLGYGASSLIPAVNVWAAGDERQRRRMAEVLLAGGRAVSGYHELAHGNDFARAEFSALPGDDGRLRLNGRKEVIANAERAEAMVLFARTSAAPGSRSHSQLFVEKADLPAGAPVHLPRFLSAGMRGVQLGGLEFRDCPIPAEAVLGAPGLGMETALRSFQVTRTALPAMTAGILETGLEVAARFADERVLYGRSLAGMPYIRSILADAFTDLLICDCLATVTARSVHLLPGESSLYASAAKYFVATLLMDAMDALSRVLGAQFYIRDGGYGIFQKHLRDLAPAGFGHTARVACLSTVLPQLPRLARKGWLDDAQPPAGVFRLGGDLPPLPFERLSVSSGGRDSLSASLAAALGSSELDGELRRLALVIAAEQDDVRRECAALTPGDLSVAARPEALRLAARYAAVLAAIACVNIWLHTHERHDAFLGDPRWAVAALRRIAERVGRDPGQRPRHVTEMLSAEVLSRHRDRRGFGLSNRRLPAQRRRH
ncbi:acyl-CoA dehydrogenase [Streptomyces sp. NPDC051963]|uniref:acyl-CoA dehydrogenase n=1 Tax=Streptomyces sp. NPDC051963 TaxID=3365678 RepID=UPI0037D91179